MLKISRLHGFLTASLLAMAATAAVAAVVNRFAGAAPEMRFVEYPMMQPQDMPTAVAAAPDGTIWFTLDLADAIGRVRDGRLERLPTQGRNIEPIGLAAASDGGAWYTDAAARAIKRIAPSGAITSFPLDTPIVRLGRLSVAPDGAAWFAEGTSFSITRLRDGALTRHVYASLPGGPYGVAAAADGTVWATLQEANQVLRIETGGRVEAFDIPQRRSVPTDIAIGSDGSVWFIQFWGNRIGRLKDGVFMEFEVPTENAGLSGIAVAEDRTVWFGMLRTGSLGRLRDGKIETFRLPRERARPYSLAIDRDGNVWYADITGYVGMLPARYARD
jgi:virginiamycin B lyase